MILSAMYFEPSSVPKQISTSRTTRPILTQSWPATVRARNRDITDRRLLQQHKRRKVLTSLQPLGFIVLVASSGRMLSALHTHPYSSLHIPAFFPLPSSCPPISCRSDINHLARWGKVRATAPPYGSSLWFSSYEPNHTVYTYD